MNNSSSNNVKWEISPKHKSLAPKWLAHDGTILVSISLRYRGFTAAVARTYLVNPSTVQEQQYRAMLEALQAAASSLKTGASMAAPRMAAKYALQLAGQVSYLAWALGLSAEISAIST